MAYQHTLSKHHQLNASNPVWQNFALHIQIPSLLTVVFISHKHTPLLHLHTVLHCHIVLHTWQSCIIFLFLFIVIFLFYFIYFIFLNFLLLFFFALWLVPMHDNAQFEPCALQE